jgi:hypothetical protein
MLLSQDVFQPLPRAEGIKAVEFRRPSQVPLVLALGGFLSIFLAMLPSKPVNNPRPYPNHSQNNNVNYDACVGNSPIEGSQYE